METNPKLQGKDISSHYSANKWDADAYHLYDLEKARMN